MSYRLTASDLVLNLATFVSVPPNDPDYLAWLHAGNTPAPFVPRTVSPRQARLALSAAGLLANVTSAVAAADQATQITWEFATEINRDDPLITTLGTALGLTSSQIDGLFINAAKL